MARKERLFVPGGVDHLDAYVHLNPLAAGIVEDPLDFPVSGHAELLGAVMPRPCDIREALLNFGEDMRTARSVYAERVRVVAEARWLSTGVQDLRRFLFPGWDTRRMKQQIIGEGVRPGKQVGIRWPPGATNRG